MPHIVEQARSGRAKCRGCGQPIAAGTKRFGERLPNPFADEGGEMTHWFHVPCAAYLRPESFLEWLTTAAGVDAIDDRERLEHDARLGAVHHRLPRVTTAGRAASGRAACRSCKEPIEKGTWRLALVYYEDGRFAPSGFIHARCTAAYLETTDVMRRISHFSPALGESDLAEVRAQIEASSGVAP
jgi:hypothetical protein